MSYTIGSQLIARTLSADDHPARRFEPVRRTLVGPSPARETARAYHDPRRIPDRVLDCVVDRLIEELTW